MENADQVGSVVAQGKFLLPHGVLAKELSGGKKKLKECSSELQKFLSAKGLTQVYDAMINAISNESKTTYFVGKIHTKEVLAIMDHYRDEYASKNVNVVLCKRKSSSGTYVWFEFIDTDSASNYVPQYDVSNFSDQIIKTVYTTLKFPNGVAVQEMKQWGSREKLKEQTPPEVHSMLSKKGLMSEYETLVGHIVDAHPNGSWRKWNTEKVNEIMHAYRPLFEEKGVSIFVSHKQEYVSHGQSGGHMEHYRWLEFVDRKLQPNYEPQRSADDKKEKCSIQ